MKKTIAVLLTLLATIAHAQNIRDRSNIDSLKKVNYESLKQVLDEHNYTCDSERLVTEASLDEYVYSAFGKVALDNNEYIANATAFSATFSSDDAQLTANYTDIVKNKPWLIWNLGGKAEADDGTYYLLKKNELNFGIGIQGGITFIPATNGFYFKPIDEKTNRNTCEVVHQLRTDTFQQLYTKYYRLLTSLPDTTKIRDAIESINRILNRPNRNTFENANAERNNIQLHTEKAELEKTLENLLEFERNSDKPYWADSVVLPDLFAFEKGITEKYSTGFHLNWWDFKGEVKNENKHVLDSTDLDAGLTPIKTFFRGSVSINYNYYHFGESTLWYARIGGSIGNGFGYDLLTPDDVTFDTTLFALNGKALVLQGDKAKVFNPYSDTNYNKKYFTAKIPFLLNVFVGAKKIIGFELSGSIGIMAGAKEFKAPFDFQGGILFSPIDKNKKTNDGTIGLVVGMKKVDFANTNAIGKDKLYFGVRVGLPLTPVLAKK